MQIIIEFNDLMLNFAIWSKCFLNFIKKNKKFCLMINIFLSIIILFLSIYHDLPIQRYGKIRSTYENMSFHISTWQCERVIYRSLEIVRAYKKSWCFLWWLVIMICFILRATWDKGPMSRFQWNWTFLLVKSFELVPRPLNKSPKPRQIMLWFNLYVIILEGKPIGLEQKKKKA
jgi:hypothetical protein